MRGIVRIARLSILAYVAFAVFGCGWVLCQEVLPNQLVYRGTVYGNVDSEPLTGTYPVTVRVFGRASGGTELWSQEFESVSVEAGVFQVMLGSAGEMPDTLFDGRQLWVETVFDGTTLVPRQLVYPVAYALMAKDALHAKYAETAGAIAGHDPQGPYQMPYEEGDPDWNHWEHEPHMFSIPSGNVGIGTTNPNSKLEVAGMIHSTSGGFRFPDGTTQASSAAHRHSLEAADGSPTDAVYVDNDGRVGIGTTTPTARLHLNGTLDETSLKLSGDVGFTTGWAIDVPMYESRNLLRLGNGNGLLAVGNSNIKLGSNDITGRSIGGNPVATVSTNHADYQIPFGIFRRSGSSVPYLAISSAEFGSNGEADVLVVDDNGNLGIGDTSPDGRLEVNPDATEDSGDEFVVKANGDVGIGTSSPAAKLDVSGDIRATGSMNASNFVLATATVPGHVETYLWTLNTRSAIVLVTSRRQTNQNGFCSYILHIASGNSGYGGSPQWNLMSAICDGTGIDLPTCTFRVIHNWSPTHATIYVTCEEDAVVTVREIGSL